MDHYLLVSGLNCTGAAYAPAITALSGHGHVHLAHTGIGENMREIATALLDTAPDRFALAGFSMGGYIAFEILRQAPERVTKLALVSTQAHPDTPDDIAKREQTIRLLEAGKIEPYMPDANDSALDPSARGRADLVTLRTRMNAQLGRDMYIRQQRAILNRIDSRPDLANITVPTMVLVGDSDEVCPPDAAQLMAQTIPNATLFTIKNAGHFAMVEQPEACMPAFEAWAKM